MEAITSDAGSYLNPGHGFVCADVLGLVRGYCGMGVRSAKECEMNALSACLGCQKDGLASVCRATGFPHQQARTACGEPIRISASVLCFSPPVVLLKLDVPYSFKLVLQSDAGEHGYYNKMTTFIRMHLSHKTLAPDNFTHEQLRVLARHFPHIQWDSQEIWSELQHDIIEHRLSTDARVIALKWFDRLCQPWREANGYFAPSYCLDE